MPGPCPDVYSVLRAGLPAAQRSTPTPPPERRTRWHCSWTSTRSATPSRCEDVEKAHQADLATQGEHGVHYLRYWVDEGHGKIFCLVDAPDAAAAETVHREAHGLVADEIWAVAEGR